MVGITIMTIFDIALNPGHDIYLNGTDIAITTESDALPQKLKIRLQFLLEEWFLDNRAGLPYIQFIFEAGSSLEDINAIFRKEIKDTEGVTKINLLEFTPDIDARSMRVDFEVNDGIASSVEVTI